ncbi:hypothetical protein BH23GEM3_BH23GEM3_17320 [soil metagenome]
MKTNGMTSAASALRMWERRQEVVANNLLLKMRYCQMLWIGMIRH